MNLHERVARFWSRIVPPNDAAAGFGADLDHLAEAFAALPAGPFDDEPAHFIAVLERHAWDEPVSAPAAPSASCDGFNDADPVPEIAAMQRMLAQGEPDRFVAASRARIAAHNSAVNAVIRCRSAEVTAPGPLAGIPYAVKDMFRRESEPMTCGSILAEEAPGAPTATVLARLDAAGAVQVAALNMSEFAQGPTGHNRHFGPARNPWDLSRVTGGSSSGSGAAVAAGMVPFALGSDTGGSVRIPASVCGVTGLKPTWSRVSRAGAMPLAPSFDVIGPLARSARDCAIVLDVIAGADLADPTASRRAVRDHAGALDGDLRRLRIAVPRGEMTRDCDAAILTRFAAALKGLKERGAAVSEVDLPCMDRIAAYIAVASRSEIAALHADEMRRRPQDYAIHVSGRMYPGYAVPATHYIEAMRRRGRVLAEFLAGAFSDADLLALPTLRRTPPTIAESDVDAGGEEALAKFLSLSANTRIFSYLGLPAISLPMGPDAEGMPTGLQLVGRPFAEPLLLRAADAFQRDTHWHLMRPPLCAQQGVARWMTT